ncbi:MAG: HAMP domain-containing histidine kinase, partial [candidate division Zixibacteria bacterium]|nr:HAMP domain-containing histidine kinase [candidate division Zixibacteria bacterium]
QRLEYSSPDDIERNRRLLMLAESAVGRAIEMTDLVTKYSRLDTERKTEPVTLRPVLEEVAEANSERIKHLNVTVSMQVADDLVVSCRSDHLYSLFSNLLVNSLDALEEVSSRRIDVSAAGENEYLRIQFADSGPGIAQQHRSRIFDPFYSTKPTRGTGLGLAIVKRIVEMYGGRIELKSPVDKGALFVIFLKSVQPNSPQGDDYNGKNG